MIRQKNSAQIRTDALKMAMQKAKAGCHACAQGYFELARKHGATEEEMRRAIDGVGEVEGKGMNRRDLLKLALAALAGVTVGADELFAQRAEAVGAYWGTDCNSASCCGIPQDFYVGRFGYGITGSTYFFNTSAAQIAGRSSTYIFWGLEGPALAPKGTSSYAWGRWQAQVAVYQRYNNPNVMFVGGGTIFADIESGFGGWSGGNAKYYAANQEVVQGFLDGIASASFYPGIYITPSDWRYYLGTTFKPDQAFVLWISGCYSCSKTICVPCSSCANTLPNVGNLLPTVSSTILGGFQAVLWQYWLDPPCGCGDFDVATQNPALGFKPVPGWTTYYSVC